MREKAQKKHTQQIIATIELCLMIPIKYKGRWKIFVTNSRNILVHFDFMFQKYVSLTDLKKTQVTIFNFTQINKFEQIQVTDLSL